MGKPFRILLSVLLFFATTAEAADWTAAGCSTAQVQAAVNSASDGDRVLIPNGSCTWSDGISTTKQIIIRAQNYTPTSGGTSSRSVTITNNSLSAPLFTITSGNSYHVGIGGIRFNEQAGAQNHIRINGSGSKVPLIFDNYFEITNRFGNEPDVSAIAFQGQGGVMWNCYLQGVGGGIGGQCCPEGASVLVGSSRSWTTASTMGAFDTNGTVNVYIEDSTWKDFGQSADIDDNGRIVFRHNTLDGVSGLTHGFTSTWGGRHFEYYDNTLASTTSNRNLGGRAFWLRAGTGLWTDNAINIPNQGYGNPPLLDVGDTTNPASGYPTPRQPGGGHNGSAYIIDPVYIWNNTGTDASTWGVGQSQWDSYFQLNRDIFVNAGAKPGWSKYTYPHPLRSVIEGGPALLSPPTNLRWSPL